MTMALSAARAKPIFFMSFSSRAFSNNQTWSPEERSALSAKRILNRCSDARVRWQFLRHSRGRRAWSLRESLCAGPRDIGRAQRHAEFPATDIGEHRDALADLLM